VRKVLVAIAFFVAFPLLLAQQTLNNDSVIKMVKVGFPEDMIVNAINRSSGVYDTSADGLIALKNAGVGSKTISAMVAKETRPAQPSAPAPPAAPPQIVPAANVPFASSTARPATEADMAEIIKLAGADSVTSLVIQQVKSEGKTPLLFSAEQRSNFARNGVDDAIIKGLGREPSPTADSQPPATTVASTVSPARNAFPRVFLGSASKGGNLASLRDQSSEMAKDFEKDCPGVQITINQAKANHTVTLNHIEFGLLTRDNQFGIYDADGDRLKGYEGGSVNSGVKGVCALIAADWATKFPESPKIEPAPHAPFFAPLK
jgi:hypothetical protein